MPEENSSVLFKDREKAGKEDETGSDIKGLVNGLCQRLTQGGIPMILRIEERENIFRACFGKT